MDQVLAQNLSPIRFADDSGTPTEVYPQNPTGGQHGIASLCSPDGRHLAMMPHPERLTARHPPLPPRCRHSRLNRTACCHQLPWQFPYMPESWKAHETSPWLKMFQNAREWCEKNA